MVRPQMSRRVTGIVPRNSGSLLNHHDASFPTLFQLSGQAFARVLVRAVIADRGVGEEGQDEFEGFWESQRWKNLRLEKRLMTRTSDDAASYKAWWPEGGRPCAGCSPSTSSCRR